MNETMFLGIFDTDMTKTISVEDFVLCIGASLLIGVLLVMAYRYRGRSSKSYLFTLALLPAIVCVVIMMVNGNIGTGLAVAGAFSLVRFRSVPGSAKEITMLFLAMGTGLLTGMGYVGFAFVFAIIMSIVTVLYNHFDFGMKKARFLHKTLNIMIPEDLDYSNVFDDVLQEFTTEYELARVKTTNMGSMYRLTYNLTMKKDVSEKEMIDLLRCRNGNLEISLSKQDTTVTEL